MDVSKLSGFSVVGPKPDSISLTKLSGFSVVGPKPDSISLTKLSGFSVVGPKPDSISLTKLSVFAVIGDPPPLPPEPPQPFGDPTPQGSEPFSLVKLRGPQTWYGKAYTLNSARYTHNQDTAAALWTVSHNLGLTDFWYEVKSLSGQSMLATKVVVNQDKFTLRFASATTGTVLVYAPNTVHVAEIKSSALNIGLVEIDTTGIKINGNYVT